MKSPARWLGGLMMSLLPTLAMAQSFNGRTNAYGTYSVAVNVPSTVQNGDLLIAEAMGFGSAPAPVDSGWTFVGGTNVYGYYQNIFSRIWSTGNQTSFSFYDSNYMGAVIRDYTGSPGIDQFGCNANSPSTPQLTIGSNETFVAFYVNNSSAVTLPTGLGNEPSANPSWQGDPGWANWWIGDGDKSVAAGTVPSDTASASGGTFNSCGLTLLGADGTQFYADDCGLPNDGLHDDAAPLRSCMETMPSGATMNLDGSKPYYFSTYGSSDPLWGQQQCELYLLSSQTLNLNGASLTDSVAVEAAGATFICAGSPNFNYPGSVSGTGNPVFYNVNPTAPNATQVVTTTAANAGNFNPGDDIYIDGGTPLLHLCVGWDEVSDVNASTGVINLKYPLLKAYPGTSSTCAGLTPRIYDWSTGNGAYNMGPLAHDVTIENGTITQVSTSSSIGPIILEGTVHPIVQNLNLHNVTNGGSGALFANNNHLGFLNNIKVDGYGCTTDFTLFPGGFTSSLNLLENSVVNSSGNPGVGCGSGEREIAYGDEQGGEGNLFKNDTATILPGNTSNKARLITCAFSDRQQGDVYDGLTCNSPAGQGFTDDITIGGSSPTVVKNSQISCYSGCLVGEVAGDQFVNNTSVGIGNGGSLNVYLPTAPVSVIGNTIIQNASGRTYALYVGNADPSYGSVIENNILKCQPSSGGSCPNGLYISSPSGESSSTQPLTIVGNQVTGFENDFVYPGAAVFPDATISDNPGLPDQSPE